MKNKLLLLTLLLSNATLFGAQGGAPAAADQQEQAPSLQDITTLSTLQMMKDEYPDIYRDPKLFEPAIKNSDDIQWLFKDKLIAKYTEATKEAARLWVEHHATNESPLELLRRHKPELARLVDEGICPWSLSFKDIIDAGGTDILASKINNHSGPLCGHFNNLSLVSLEGFKTIFGTNQVESLYFQHNQLIIIDKDTFDHLPQLLNLYFTNNQITIINKDAFKNLAKLRILIFSNNQIPTIHSETFKGLNELKDLCLKNNQLTEIHQDTFQSLLKLERFSLQGNQLTQEQVDLISHKVPVNCRIFE